MPGILGMMRAEPFLPNARGILNRMAEPLRYAPDQTVQHFERGHFAGAVVDYGPRFPFLKPAAAERDGVLLFMEGEVFPEASEVPHELRGDSPEVQRAEYCLTLYLRHGAKFAAMLNGAFSLAIYDGRDDKLRIYTDRFPSRLLVYWRSAEGFLFASSVRSLLSYGPQVGTRYDKLGLAELIAFERILGEKTLFEDISRLPPACCACWDGRRLTLERYRDYPAFGPPQGVSGWKDAAESLLETLRTAIRKRTSDGSKAAVMLSGGIDSRLVLAVSPPGVMAATLCNEGQSDTRETRLARRSAGICGVESVLLRRGADYYARMAEPAAEILEGFCTFVTAHYLGVHEQLQRAGVEVVFTGLYFDTLFKNYHEHRCVPPGLYPTGPHILRSRRLARILADRPTLRRGDRQDLAVLVLSKEMKDAYAVARERAIQNMAEWLDSIPETAAALPTLAPRDLHSSGTPHGQLRLLRTMVVERSPVYDNDLFDIGWHLPTDWTKGGRIVRRALHYAHPRLARLPDSNTGLPAGLCPPWDDLALGLLELGRRAGRYLAKYSNIVARLRRPDPGTEAFTQGSWFNHNGVFRRCPAYRDVVLKAIQSLDDRYFDLDQIMRLYADDLQAAAPRLNTAFEALITFGLFDRKWGPQTRVMPEATPRASPAVACRRPGL